MVDSTLTDEKRRLWNRMLGALFVLMVGASAGLMALEGGGSPPEVAGVSAIGILFGAGLAWYLASLRTSAREMRRQQRERHRERRQQRQQQRERQRRR